MGKKANRGNGRRGAGQGGNRKLRAVGYGRCSTEEQQSRTEYNTLESQRDYVLGYVRSVHPEWEFAGWYEDPACSGKDTNRPGLQSLLLDCERGKFDVVVTYKLDRITRSLSDFFGLDRIFTEHDVSFISVKEQFDTSTAMGRAMRNIALTFAELEREMTAERTKDKMVSQVRQGRWPGGNLPFGYDVKDGRLVPNPVEAPALRMIFETFSEKKSLAGVRDKLLALGIPPKRINYHSETPRRIQEWNKTKIAYILQNRVYLGELNYDGIRVPETHDPLVDERLFNLVQATVAQGVRKPKPSVDYDYFLAGKAICGDCGCRMTPKSTYHPQRKKRLTPYYECYRLSKYRRYQCEVKRINADLLEYLFLQVLDKLSWDRELIARGAADTTTSGADAGDLKVKESALVERVSVIDGKIRNILAAVEDGLVGASVQARLQELESQKVVVESELAGIRSRLRQVRTEPVDVEYAMQLFGRLSELFPQGTTEQKERLVDYIVKQVTVDRDKSVEFELYLPEKATDVVQSVKSGCRTRTRT